MASQNFEKKSSKSANFNIKLPLVQLKISEIKIDGTPVEKHWSEHILKG